MIKVRYSAEPSEDEIYEVVATNACVHLRVLSDDSIVLIVEVGKRRVHMAIFHDPRRRVPPPVKDDR